MPACLISSLPPSLSLSILSICFPPSLPACFPFFLSSFAIQRNDSGPDLDGNMYLSLFISTRLFYCEIVSQVVINSAKTSPFIAQFAISVKKMLILRSYYQIVISVLSDIDSYAVFCHSRSLVLHYSFFMTAFLVKMINEPYHFSQIKSV